jgi:hypothetical protein
MGGDRKKSKRVKRELNWDEANPGLRKGREKKRKRRGWSAEPTWCDDCGHELCDEHEYYDEDCEFCIAHEDCE